VDCCRKIIAYINLKPERGTIFAVQPVNTVPLFYFSLSSFTNIPTIPDGSFIITCREGNNTSMV
jgi:hypothetical protein